MTLSALDNRAQAERADLAQALEAAARPRYITLEGDVLETADGVCVCGVAVPGTALRAHLGGCKRAMLFAATLGAEVDRLISRYSVLSMADAYALDLLASARIEAYCDAVQEALSDRPDGLYLRPRFSPGYGDVAVDISRGILNALDAPKRLGLCCTQRGMLTPVKSVTAFIGITAEKQSCHMHKCAACPKTDCAFRKEV